MTKTKDDFANPQAGDWWLLEEQLSAELEPRRLALGAAHGWNYANWYTEPAKLEELYDWLAANDTQLLNNLDYAEDETTKAKWLDDFVEAVSVKEEEAREAESAEIPGVPEAKEPEAPVAPPEPAKKSLFAKKHAQDESEASEGEAQQAETVREPERARDGDAAPVAPPSPEEAQAAAAEHEKAAAAAAEVLDQADLPSETKKVLEEYITNSAVPVDAGEVEELLKEFPDDFEQVFEEAKKGLDEEIDSFLSELDELEEEEGDEGADEELEDEGEEVEA
jgi:hypothetical protein